MVATLTFDTPTLREFIRYVYDEGGASEATRQAFVSTWRQSALDAIRDGGNITSTSSNSASVGFSVPSGWSPSAVMELANRARSYLSESLVTDALASVPSRVTRFQTATTNLRVTG